jgi:hypothetical protein
MEFRFMNLSTSAACAAAACMLLAHGSAQAAPLPSGADGNGDVLSDTAPDYIYTMPLTVSGRQGVVGLRLPQAVYLHAHSASLNDVRIFDATGAKLVFTLQTPPPQEHIQRLSLPVKLFPILSAQPRPASGGAIDLDIRTAADGSLLSVKAKSAPGTQAAHLVGLVLDARQPEPAQAAATATTATTVANKPPNAPLIEALHFNLPPGTASYSAQVWLEVSDDLKQWETIGAADLSWLVNSATQTLSNDRLEFEPRSFRYARLTWRSGEPLAFAAITAESIAQTTDAPVIDKVLLQPVAGKEPQDLVYNAAVAIPVEKIGLQFTEPNVVNVENVVFPAAIGSYQELPSRQLGQPNTLRFQPFTSATFYQITQEGKTRRSGDIAIPLTHRAQWVLRPLAASTAKPALALSWQPASLIFLTSGKGPYTLAFGRDKVKAASLDLSQVAPGFSAAELKNLEQATLGPLQTQTGRMEAEESAAAAAASAAKMRTLALWGVLLLGVAVLGVLAWRLIKQMQQAEKN